MNCVGKQVITPMIVYVNSVITKMNVVVMKMMSIKTYEINHQYDGVVVKMVTTFFGESVNYFV